MLFSPFNQQVLVFLYPVQKHTFRLKQNNVKPVTLWRTNWCAKYKSSRCAPPQGTHTSTHAHDMNFNNSQCNIEVISKCQCDLNAAISWLSGSFCSGCVESRMRFIFTNITPIPLFCRWIWSYIETKCQWFYIVVKWGYACWMQTTMEVEF